MSKFAMPNIEDFYVLGIPIETEVGNAEFLKVKDYPQYFFHLQNIGRSKLEIIQNLRDSNQADDIEEIINEMKEMNLFEIVFSVRELLDSYVSVFSRVFNDDKVISSITADNFDYYRQLIMRMNSVKEEEINPNPEIQRAIERSKRVKAQGKEQLSFADICSSVVVYSGITYQELLDFTIYGLYMTFQRIGIMKDYDTSTLFATVSPDIKIGDWSRHIDLYKEESHFMTESEFSKTQKAFEN